jgi:hypothetical protein
MYIKQQTIQWPKDRGQIWFTSNNRQYNDQKIEDKQWFTSNNRQYNDQKIEDKQWFTKYNTEN